jgi:RHH-type transcriptional regulator, rel operon repressor / antitoxin RelB
MLAIRLPQSIEKRLDRLARRTGRTKTYYAREAILEYLADLEDVYLAEESLERVRRGQERTVPLSVLLRRYANRNTAKRNNLRRNDPKRNDVER